MAWTAQSMLYEPERLSSQQLQDALHFRCGAQRLQDLLDLHGAVAAVVAPAAALSHDDHLSGLQQADSLRADTQLVAQVGAVIVGFDKLINYYKIQYATLCISENPGCLFIATNLDARTHLTDAQEWAGNGSMVGAIKGAVLEGKRTWFSSCSLAARVHIVCGSWDRLPVRGKAAAESSRSKRCNQG